MSQILPSTQIEQTGSTSLLGSFLFGDTKVAGRDGFIYALSATKTPDESLGWAMDSLQDSRMVKRALRSCSAWRSA